VIQKKHSKKSELLTHLIRGIRQILILKNRYLIEKNAFQHRQNRFQARCKPVLMPLKADF
jgi:hypothetical protein